MTSSGFLEPELQAIERHVVRVPAQPRSEVPRYMRLADVLVQPGRSNGFNDYRLPSKLPEFLATGRPVVLPATNLGRFLEDGEECILLRRGDALEIAAVIERHPRRRGAAARAWRRAAAPSPNASSAGRERETLQAFYERGLDLASPPLDLADDELRRLERGTPAPTRRA